MFLFLTSDISFVNERLATGDLIWTSLPQAIWTPLCLVYPGRQAAGMTAWTHCILTCSGSAVSTNPEPSQAPARLPCRPTPAQAGPAAAWRGRGLVPRGAGHRTGGGPGLRGGEREGRRQRPRLHPPATRPGPPWLTQGAEAAAEAVETSGGWGGGRASVAQGSRVEMGQYCAAWKGAIPPTT